MTINNLPVLSWRKSGCSLLCLFFICQVGRMSRRVQQPSKGSSESTDRPKVRIRPALGTPAHLCIHTQLYMCQCLNIKGRDAEVCPPPRLSFWVYNIRPVVGKTGKNSENSTVRNKSKTSQKKRRRGGNDKWTNTARYKNGTPERKWR